MRNSLEELENVLQTLLDFSEHTCSPHLLYYPTLGVWQKVLTVECTNNKTVTAFYRSSHGICTNCRSKQINA